MKPVYPASSLAENHPFAQYVHILGRGKTGTRSLTQEEAKQAMTMMLNGEAEEAQLGAFLMLLRVKEESPEELAGFVEASREHINAPDMAVDVDWSSYAGKKNQLPWLLLSAQLLAKNGLKIFIHGADGTQEQRLYTQQSCEYLEIPIVANWQDCNENLQQGNICYMPMEAMSRNFYELLFYRRLLGLRSVMHSQARLLNPLKAPISLQGVFHPAYAPSHQEASRILNQAASAGFKGEGGEAEIRPDAKSKIFALRNNQPEEIVWPRLYPERASKQTELHLSKLKAVWDGEKDAYGEAAVIATTALVLYLKNPSFNQETAFKAAEDLWHKRH